MWSTYTALETTKTVFTGLSSCQSHNDTRQRLELMLLWIKFHAFLCNECTFQELVNDANNHLCFTVFIRKGKDKKAELVLLDHGLYDFLQPQDRMNLCRLYKAIILRDEDGMKLFSNQLGVNGKLKGQVTWPDFVNSDAEPSVASIIERFSELNLNQSAYALDLSPYILAQKNAYFKLLPIFLASGLSATRWQFWEQGTVTIKDSLHAVFYSHVIM